MNKKLKRRCGEVDPEDPAWKCVLDTGHGGDHRFRTRKEKEELLKKWAEEKLAEEKR